MRDLDLLLQNYRLTTAEIVYHMPDHPHVLQTFVWQQLDLAPRYPRLERFVEFWERSIEARLHSVRIASAELLQPNRLRHLKHQLHLH